MDDDTFTRRSQLLIATRLYLEVDHLPVGYTRSGIVLPFTDTAVQVCIGLDRFRVTSRTAACRHACKIAPEPTSHSVSDRSGPLRSRRHGRDRHGARL